MTAVRDGPEPISVTSPMPAGGRGPMLILEEVSMYLTRRDLAGTIVAALVVLVYIANVQE